MQANPLLEPALDIGAVGARKPHFLDGLVYLDFLFFGAEVKTHEILGVACGSGLGEMHHIDGSLALVHQLLHFGGKFRGAVAEVKRDRSLRGTNRHGLPAGVLRHFPLKKFRRTDGGAHQEKPALRERQERNLPGHPTFPVGIVMEFVHHHISNGKFFALAEGHVA